MQHYDLSFLPVGCLRPSFFPPQLLLNSLARYLRGTNKKVWTTKFFFFWKAEWLLKSYTTRINEKGRNGTSMCIEYVNSNVDIKYSLQGSPLHDIQYNIHPISAVYCLRRALPPITSPRQTLNTTNTVKTGPHNFTKILKQSKNYKDPFFVPSLLLLIILAQWPDREGA